jgi:hypothetical protein
MSDELRTAAIEATETAISQVWAKYGSFAQMAEEVVDAVLPLLVAGTASRIADAIEATSYVLDGGFGGEMYVRGQRKGLDEAAGIARRVGETS